MVHREIDQFYYMQKAEQLELLQEQLKEAQERLRAVENRIDDEYRNVFLCWVKDVRWLNRNINRKPQVGHAEP